MARRLRSEEKGPYSCDRGATDVSARVKDTAAVRRGDIFYADLSPVVGSEQRGIRPVLVVQNDVANRLSPTVVVCALTSRLKRPSLPTHVLIRSGRIRSGSVALLEQLRTLDKRRLLRRIGHVDILTMRQVDAALGYALGLCVPESGKRSAVDGAASGSGAAVEDACENSDRPEGGPAHKAYEPRPGRSEA